MKASLSLALAAASLLGASGCIVERERIADRAPLAPPPPPSDEADAAAPGSEVYAEAPPPPGTEVDEDVFYARLSPYGHWRWTPDYGRVWVPTVAYGWRPYTYGHWVLTDWGWTFVSDDPWGWAAYHYGSWGYGPAFGWYWVPGRIWAPAWVSWRWGAGYACWAPIGPAGFVYAWSSPAWVVVPQQHFTRPIVGNVVAPQVAGPIVSQAQPLSGPHAAPAPGRQFGPPVPQVQQAVGHPIAAVPARAILRPVPSPIVGGGPASQAGALRDRGGITRDGPRAGGVGPAPAPGPLRSPVPPRPPPSENRPRYGVSNTGRPYYPRGDVGQPPRGGAGQGWSGARPYSGAGQGWGGARPYGGAGHGGGGGSGGGYAPRVGGAPMAPRAGGAAPAPHPSGGGGSPPPPASRGGGGHSGDGGHGGGHAPK